MKKIIQLLLQYILPHHFITALAGILAKNKLPWLKNFLIKKFIQHYKVNMSEAIEPDYTKYASFNDFFTRKLHHEARPINDFNRIIISPVDGKISQFGQINNNLLLQAKGKTYTLEQLCYHPEIAQLFYNGNFATIYLSPKDYHRIHMPITGKLHCLIYVPGTLFTVNDLATHNIKNVFGRNERVIAVFDTLIGPMAVILVGAMIVGGICLSWLKHKANTINKSKPYIHRYIESDVILQKGDELGFFELGSTVILLFAENSTSFVKHLNVDDNFKVGEMLAKIKL